MQSGSSNLAESFAAEFCSKWGWRGKPGFFRNGARVGGEALTGEERPGSAWSVGGQAILEGCSRDLFECGRM
ncbi:unnamed protein product [Prunus armeniaca]|uniref:Uncharacterized protein n=1 Tax=Prunus armeniaca TaxID=36596 RepID=A0A6J5Y1N8_PRUAR|nr:unnamed protein product [Prunus armeniaca]CAB4318423.1 unnamed protein product [Prunus armeniaca]